MYSLASGTPWTLEALVSGAATDSASVGLFSETGLAGAPLLSASGVTTGGVQPQFVSASFADSLTGFASGGNYELQVKSGSGGSVNVYRAGLWVTLDPVTSGESQYKVADFRSTAASADISE